jgi:hypothetical protein
MDTLTLTCETFTCVKQVMRPSSRFLLSFAFFFKDCLQPLVLHPIDNCGSKRQQKRGTNIICKSKR